MTDSDKLREQMWDMVYGLLSSDESQALITRIKSDPGAARLYAEVRLQADLVGYASRVEDSAFALEVPGAAGKPVLAKAYKHAAGEAVAVHGADTRGGKWLVGAAATALALLLAVGHFWPQPNERQIASRFIVTEVESPSPITAGLTNKIALRTFRLDAAGERNSGVPTNVDVLVRSRDGKELLRQKVVTSGSGQGAIDLPGPVLETGARLEMETAEPSAAVAYEEMQDADRSERDEKLGETALALDLPVQPEPPVAYFLQADPVATPGKPMQVATWNFSSFSARPIAQEAAREAAKNIPGVVLAEPAGNALGDFNVVNGVVPATEAGAPDAGALAFQVQDQERNRTAGGAMLGQRSASPAAPGAAPAAVRLQQAQGAERRDAAKPAAEASAKEVQLELQDRAKLGRQELAAGGKAAEEAQPPAPTILAGEPLAVEVPAELAGKPVVAAAVARGVTVASAPVAGVPVAEGSQAAGVSGFGAEAKRAGQSVTLNVPPEADGRIDVALVDQSFAPPQVVNQQTFYRQPARKLQIDLPNLQQRFTPGERVQLQLQVTDEAGQPAAETLVGVRVWNEAVVKQAAQQPATLEAAVRDGVSSWGDQAADGKDLAKLTESIRKEQLASAPSANAVMPVRVSNLAAVQARFESAVAAAQSQRQAIVQTIGGVVIVGGLLLAVALGVLAVSRISSKLSVGAPALAVAVASLLIGMVWVGWWSPADEKQIAFAPQAKPSVATAESAGAVAGKYAADPQLAAPQPATTAAPGADSLSALGAILDKKADEAGGERFGAALGGRGGAGGAAAEGKGLPELERRLADDRTTRGLAREAPASLYFNPQLLTDAGGRVTIEFVMPPGESEYRLLIDALGHGRIGSKQQLIIGRAADGK